MMKSERVEKVEVEAKATFFATSLEEQQTRSQVLLSHLRSLDPMDLWKIERYSKSWNLIKICLTFLSALKPAVQCNPGEYEQFVERLIPPGEENKYEFTSNNWLYHKESIRRVIIKHPKHFTDFDIKKIADDSYLKTYIESMETSVFATAQKRIQTGLLFGFPINSVIAHTNEEKLGGFHAYGYNFSVLDLDKELFNAHLGQAYHLLGLNKFWKELKLKWKKEYQKKLMVKESLKIIAFEQLNFFEILAPNSDHRGNSRVLILLTKNNVGESDVAKLLSIVSNRYEIDLLGSYEALQEEAINILKSGIGPDELLYFHIYENVHGARGGFIIEKKRKIMKLLEKAFLHLGHKEVFSQVEALI